MFGLISSIVAGIAMSLQGVFNTRLGEKIGLWETNVLVQGIGFILTLAILFFLGNGNFKNLSSSNKLYLLGGPLGVIIIFTVMNGIQQLGATYAISAILVSQLLAAGLIDALGLFESKKIHFGTNEILGIVIMIAGIIVFQWKR
ncbi:DMT family transporter [Clostridium sp. ZS2-4]|uniref:DMT family transporter n=1 Tax=Clostridium sp. ZS2-4 TaxID=2987703 RepID=UPI00227D2739|nr:DMT family transporter [Clostridium sp. ZS2-4]MCY6355194.1 DMT family transporter [Clostridium sp. ZS2-4]